MEKPIIWISKCLGFANCRWNAQPLKCQLIQSLSPWLNFIPICPEEEIDLGTPRRPLRLVRNEHHIDLYQPATEQTLTTQMQLFCDRFFEQNPLPDGAILKALSPSCGPHRVKIYHKNIPSEKGQGLFAQAIQKKFPRLPIEDEGRLNNFSLRDQWLIQVFANANFRQIIKIRKKSNLVQFHSSYKYLIMACSPTLLKEMGQLVASSSNDQKLYLKYQELLQKSLHIPLKQKGLINALEHIYGYFKNKLSTEEKNFFFDTIEDFRRGGVPLSVPLALLHSWALRFDSGYIKKQVLLKMSHLAGSSNF